MKFFHPYAAPLIPAPPHVREVLSDDDLRNARELLDELRVYRDTLRRDLRQQRVEFFEDELVLREAHAPESEVEELEMEFSVTHRATLTRFLNVARAYTSLSCEVRRYLARK